MTAPDELGVAHRWLEHRIDRAITEAGESLLRQIADDIAMATNDAVVIRRLSAGHRNLRSVALSHPYPQWDDAIRAAVAKAENWRGDGLWQPVIEDAELVRWSRAVDGIPATATAVQVDFMQNVPITGFLVAPIIVDDRSAGGIVLMRFGSDKPQTAEDERLLVKAAERIASVFPLLDVKEAGDTVSPEP